MASDWHISHGLVKFLPHFEKEINEKDIDIWTVSDLSCRSAIGLTACRWPSWWLGKSGPENSQMWLSGLSWIQESYMAGRLSDKECISEDRWIISTQECHYSRLIDACQVWEACILQAQSTNLMLQASLSKKIWHNKVSDIDLLTMASKFDCGWQWESLLSWSCICQRVCPNKASCKTFHRAGTSHNSHTDIRIELVKTWWAGVSFMSCPHNTHNTCYKCRQSNWVCDVVKSKGCCLIRNIHASLLWEWNWLEASFCRKQFLSRSWNQWRLKWRTGIRN